MTARRILLATLCLLALATSASAEPTRMTDSRGPEWIQDGASTCVLINATFMICGRTMLPEPGQQMTMQPTHDCSRSTATDPSMAECVGWYPVLPNLPRYSQTTRSLVVAWVCTDALPQKGQ